MSSRKPADFFLFILIVILVLIGVLMVYDASYARATQDYGSASYFFKRQVIFAIAGLALMLLVSKLPYWKLKPLAIPLLILSIIGLAAVFVPGIGESSHGAKRWIRIFGIQFQPSEFAKLCLVIYLASALSIKKQELRDWKSGLLPMAFPIGLIVLLVVIEDMGTAIIIVGAILSMLYMAGAKKRHFAVALGACFVGGIGFIIAEPYRWHRILAFLDPFKDYHGKGYQVCQSLIALGSGGIFGQGIGEGRQKLFYLPAEHTDFIFAVLGQEAGLIGTAVIALIFIMFAAKGFDIAIKTKEGFGKLLAAGLCVMISGQALLNMLVVTSSVPATGVPLPFISYGGSSLLLNLLSAGILLGISQYPGLVNNYEYEDRINRRRHRRARVSRD